MDRFSYNSCPDSAESSPRSRDVEFENPPPWEDQNQNQQSYNKVKFMCSYGGKIQPRQHDNQLTYINGDTKLISVERSIRFSALVTKLSTICSGEISFKYQLPGEDLDALISVSNDDDLDHMMHEYDRLVRLSTKPARMRLFLFPSSSISGGFGDSEGLIKSDKNPSRFESEKSVTAPPNNVEFLIGTEKVSAPTPPSPRPRMIQPNHGVNPAEIQRQIQEFQRIQISDQEQQQQHHQNQLHQPNHGLNPAEIQRQVQDFQRIQIRDQEQQQQQQYQNQLHHQEQEAILHQNQMHQQQQEAIIHQNQLHQQQQEVRYRRKSEDEEARRYFPGNVYKTKSLNLPEQQQQVYMISGPGPSPSTRTLYQNVQRSHHYDGYMEQQNQQGYNLVQPQPLYSQMGKPVYYTTPGEGMMVHQPQYQGMGQQASNMTDLRSRPSGD